MTGWSVSNDLTVDEIDTAYRWISSETYWARGMPRDLFERSVANSVCFALHDTDGAFRGFARVVTDKATFGYLCDVFVCPSVRGRGGGKALIQEVMAHPDLQLLRRWMLATQDAHSLYAQYGFEAPANPERLMVRHDPDLYLRLASQDR